MPVNTKHDSYMAMASKWKRCRDVYAGQDAVHKAGVEYLPKLKEQPDDEYQAYVKRATFYNATYRTISGLVGMLFRQPPKLEAPDQVKELLDDVTMAGVPLHLFVQEVSDDSLSVGRVGILVDYPKATVVGLTMADAQKLNLRPTMQLYKTETIINWRTERRNNQMMLVLVVLAEVAETPKDEFSTDKKEQFRVLDLIDSRYRVRIMERKDDKDVLIEETFPLMNGAPLDYIPFVFIGTDDVTDKVDEPPLIDLVDMNLSHYRTNADLEHGAHFTALPTAVIAGYKPTNPGDKLYIGSTAAWVFPDPQAHAEFLEFTGQGLNSLTDIMSRKESQMAILGARMLEPQKKAAETAESETIHRKGEESMLSAVAQSISLGVTRALEWFCEWAGSPSDDIEFDLNRDFYPVPMGPAELAALISAWQQGAISDQTLFAKLQQGEIIAQGKTLEEEQEEIKNSAIIPQPGATVDPVTGLPISGEPTE